MKSKNIKILFISFNEINNSNYGGAQCSKRNTDMLEDIGIVDTYIVRKKSNIHSLGSALFFYFPPFSKDDELNIINLIKERNYDFIFFDSSLLGQLIKKIKNNFTIPAITFFHNVELDYINVRFGKKYIKYPYKFLAWLSEKSAINYSDKIICLNKRDSLRIKSVYSRTTDAIIPITFKNKINRFELLENYGNVKERKEKTCLFVGAYSHSNYEGIKWFIQNVADKISVNVKVVGSGFEGKVSELSKKNVEVIGYVEDLEKIYLEADCVISPLLFGGGMKVKIAEAMMYGKTIFGSTEAFEGYDVDPYLIGGICNSADEYTEKINEFMKKPVKFNDYSRKIFEENYTDYIAAKKFRQLLEIEG